MKTLLDPAFVYYKSVDTDLRRTFKRVRKEQAEAAKREAELAAKVKPIKREQGAK